jgi:hypothetical protein
LNVAANARGQRLAALKEIFELELPEPAPEQAATPEEQKKKIDDPIDYRERYEVLCKWFFDAPQQAQPEPEPEAPDDLAPKTKPN